MIALYKPAGKTPLEMIELLRKHAPEYTSARLGYAGRLDPMADGLLLILEGEENLKRKDFELLQKEYTVRVLFGIETDTYDIMGLITRSRIPENPIDLNSLALQYTGSFLQQYPPYSSPRVKGKPLFYWARENRLHEITIPEKMVQIFKIAVTEVQYIQAEEIVPDVIRRVSLVNGEFRQKEIIEKWNQWLLQNPKIVLPCATIHVACSSGTYMRSLAHAWGNDTGYGAIAYSITRTAIGDISSSAALHLE